MGRAAGAVLTVVAPEAKAAGAAAAAGRRRRPPAADPRVSAPGSTAARQRDAIEQIKDARPAEDPASPATPPPASPGDGAPARRSLSVPSVPAAASTGSGFALGVLAWALGLAYLQGGAPGVKAWLSAKFLNKV